MRTFYRCPTPGSLESNRLWSCGGNRAAYRAAALFIYRSAVWHDVGLSAAYYSALASGFDQLINQRRHYSINFSDGSARDLWSYQVTKCWHYCTTCYNVNERLSSSTLGSQACAPPTGITVGRWVFFPCSPAVWGNGANPIL